MVAERDLDTVVTPLPKVIRVRNPEQVQVFLSGLKVVRCPFSAVFQNLVLKTVNVARLAELVTSGKVDASTEITPETLRGAGLIGKNDLVKILGGGDLDTALKVSAHAFSASAKQKIESAGGTATAL